jgi:hypothetical protein
MDFFESGPDNPQVILNNTYKSVRIHSSEYDIYYSVWCTNEHQLYDLKVRAFLDREPDATDGALLIFHRLIHTS